MLHYSHCLRHHLHSYFAAPRIRSLTSSPLPAVRMFTMPLSRSSNIEITILMLLYTGALQRKSMRQHLKGIPPAWNARSMSWGSECAVYTLSTLVRPTARRSSAWLGTLQECLRRNMSIHRASPHHKESSNSFFSSSRHRQARRAPAHNVSARACRQCKHVSDPPRGKPPACATSFTNRMQSGEIQPGRLLLVPRFPNWIPRLKICTVPVHKQA